MNVFDIAVVEVHCSFFRFDNRMPLKFGHEISTGGETVEVAITVRGADGRTAVGYGETPLAAAWSWPSVLTQAERVRRMREFCDRLVIAWQGFDGVGHPMEIGFDFLESHFRAALADENKGLPEAEKLPYLAALVCNSAFDLAVYDAYGILHDIRAFDSFKLPYMNRDLSSYYGDRDGAVFAGVYPDKYLLGTDDLDEPLPACHLVGGKDPLEIGELTGEEPQDGHPVLLREWIARDGLFNLKIKLAGNDASWDYTRIVDVGRIALENDVQNLTVDFNCTVEDPAYVCDMLDRLRAEHPAIDERIRYVEQPFPYDLDQHAIDVHQVSERKLLLMDESAHDWRFVARGRELGWTGVALKTCKTLTGAMLSLCWAREHEMAIMVQDLTNPRLAMVPHALLAARAGTIMGVEVNSMQFCPDASIAQARVHPGLYRRVAGCISLATLGDTGFGYRRDEIQEDGA